MVSPPYGGARPSGATPILDAIIGDLLIRVHGGDPVCWSEEEIRLLNQTIRSLGSGLDNPLWTLVFLSFTSVLQLRLTYAGVYDVRRGEIVF